MLRFAGDDGEIAQMEDIDARGRVNMGIKFSEAYNINYDLFSEQFPDWPRGVLIEYVEPLRGAFKAGVMAGDVITRMCGEQVADYKDMLRIRETLSPGDIIEIEVFRRGEYLTAELEISEETGGNSEIY